MATLGSCKFYGAPENNDRIFRFCSRAAMVWNSNPSSLMIGINANVNFRGWLDGNAKRLQHEEPKIVTNVPFISTMWSIW